MSSSASLAAPRIDKEDRAPLSAWYALAVLILTVMFAFLDRQILNLILPSLQQDFRLTDMQLGMLQGLGMAIFAGVAGYPMGWLADRYGRKLLLVLGIVVWSLSTAACALQTTFAGIFLCTIGIAVGEAGLTPIIFAFLPDLFGARQRHTANFIVFGASLLAASIGAGLSGAALQWLTLSHAALPETIAAVEPWRLAMVLVALPAPIFIFLVATLPVHRAARDRAAVSTAGIAPFIPFVAANWKTFACIFGAIAGYGMSITGAFVWLPLAALRAFGMPPAQAGIHMGGTMALGAIAGVVLPAIGLKMKLRGAALKPVQMAPIFALLTIAPTVCLSLAPSPSWLFTAAGLQLLFCLATASCMPSIVQDFSPPSLRSRILSLVTIAGALAQAASALAIGAISGWLATARGVLIGMSVIQGAGLALAAVLLLLAAGPVEKTVRSLDA